MTRDKSILILGISEQVQETLAFALKREGYEVITAAGDEEALALVREFSFDFILSDLHRRDGMDTLQQIKRHLPGAVILATRTPTGNDWAAPVEDGPVDCWIDKPIRIPDIKNALRRGGRPVRGNGSKQHTRHGKLEFKDAVRSFEKDLIEEALQRTDWVKSRAARLLNINRTTLIEKMKRQNIPS
jgi:DNA-binding NtrC family response regulator